MAVKNKVTEVRYVATYRPATSLPYSIAPCEPLSAVHDSYSKS